MANKKKIAPITLRMTPQHKAELKGIADSFGLDMNGLLNLMVARFKGQMKIEAGIYHDVWVHPEKWEGLLRAWKKLNPGRKQGEFFVEYIQHRMEESSELDGLQPLPAKRGKNLPSFTENIDPTSK